MNATLEPTERERYDQGLIFAREALPEEAFRQEWETGRGLPLADAMAEALQVAMAIAHAGAGAPTGSS